jgi:hypothetical protein
MHWQYIALLHCGTTLCSQAMLWMSDCLLPACGKLGRVLFGVDVAYAGLPVLPTCRLCPARPQATPLMLDWMGSKDGILFAVKLIHRLVSVRSSTADS